MSRHPTRRSGPMLAATAAVLACAVPLCATLGDRPGLADGPRPPWAVLVVLFALAQLCVVRLRFRRSVHSFTLAEIPLVVGLSFLAPLGVVTAWVFGAGIALALRRPPLVRLVFSLATVALAGAVAAAVLHAVAALGDARAVLWAGLYAGAIAATLVSALLAALATATAGGERSPRRSGRMSMACATAVAAASLGLAIVAVLEVDPWAAPALAPVGAALFAAFRAYGAERERHLSLELLHETTRLLALESDVRLGLAGVLARSLNAFRAESAEALLLADGLRVAVGFDGHVETSDLDDPALTVELRAHGPAAEIVTPTTAGGALGAHLRGHGVERAMLAVLAGDDGPLGVLLVAGPAITRADMKLFETLARQSGSMLGRTRLGREVRELSALRLELERQAFHDPLTGLANRLLFMDRLRHALTRRQGAVAVIYIDLDDFKPINDTLGHEAGDAVLEAVARRLDGTLRGEDTPARLGGDEFAVLLLDVTEAQATLIAERLLSALRRPLTFAGSELAIAASIGVAQAPSGSLTGEELLRNADAAMYVSKHGGKRAVSVYDAR